MVANRVVVRRCGEQNPAYEPAHPHLSSRPLTCGSTFRNAVRELSAGFPGSAITVEDWALIRSLAAEGVPKARIAARLGISRTAVTKAVNSDAPPPSSRGERHSARSSLGLERRKWTCQACAV